MSAQTSGRVFSKGAGRVGTEVTKGGGARRGRSEWVGKEGWGERSGVSPTWSSRIERHQAG